ncbi:MAG: outer membrane beta-barrel protein [Bacteroidales bacterium]|nr:outer membrane beta-barrel protein [Bacteroidales bacterium]
MKKMILAAALAGAAVLSMNAQLSFSLNAGMADDALVSKWTVDGKDKTETENISGAYLGFTTSYELVPGMAINSVMQMKYLFDRDDVTATPGTTRTEVQARNILSLEMPLRASYRYDSGDVGLFVYAGPVFEIGLINNTVTPADGDDPKIVSYYGDNAPMKRYDMRMGGGVGIIYKHFMLKGGYDFGLIDRSNHDNVSMYTRSLKVGLGYTF